jgi:hypothetical protein
MEGNPMGDREKDFGPIGGLICIAIALIVLLVI